MKSTEKINKSLHKICPFTHIDASIDKISGPSCQKAPVETHKWANVTIPVAKHLPGLLRNTPECIRSFPSALSTV